MKKITLDNYQSDKYYARIVRAVDSILAEGDLVTTIDLFVRMELLTADSVQNWRSGRIPYLEKAIICNLSRANRILRIFRMHAHDLNLRPSITAYRQYGSRRPLRFTKSGDEKVEEPYSRHFLRVVSKRTKTHAAEPSIERTPFGKI